MRSFSEIIPIGKLFDMGLSKSAQPGEETVSIETGFHDLDGLLSLKCGELLCLGARPGMGKTSLMLDLALNLSRNHHVLFHSVEYDLYQLFRRIALKTGTNIPGRDTEVEVQTKEFKNSLGQFEDHSLSFIDGYPKDTVRFFDEIRERIEDTYCNVLFLDCADILSSSFARVSHDLQWLMLEGLMRLKKFCAESEILLIISSQLDRKLEQRKDKRPRLDDLIIPGLERVCDKVCFLYRPEYYGITRDHEGNYLTGMTELLLERNMRGVTGKATIFFNSKYGRFEDWEVGESSKL